MKRTRLSSAGQAAMEYLMTYGWAILVVMIVGIVMWQLGIFNMGSTTVTSTGFARLKPQLAGIGLSSTGEFKGIFMNGAGTTIYIAGGRLDGAGTTCAISGPLTVVSAGDNFKLTGAQCVSGLKLGDVYTAHVYVTYGLNIGGVDLTHVEYGTVRGPLEAG